MSKRLLAIVFAAIITASTTNSVLLGQDYLGILPEMLKPEVAERIELTEEQRDKVTALIRSRRSAVIGLSQQLKEAPLSQKTELQAQFNADSEKRAFSLLDANQQDKLAKYRVEWLGMLALADPVIAKEMNLAEWQREVVAEWSDKVRKNSRSSSNERTRNEAQQAIRSEISNSQWARWQLLAGQIEESTVGPPFPPNREVETPAQEETTSNTPELAASPDFNSFMPVEEVQLELNFQGQPWGEVIKWLARQADLSMQSDVVPPGTFN